VGVKTRQVFDIDISRVVTEYQSEVLENAQGQCFIAQLPVGVTKAVQYGTQIKAHAVYLSQHQLLPYNRIQTYFSDQCQIPISEVTLFNFNLQAFKQLADFERLSKDQLSQASIAHADETGININGKRHWLHCASNASLTHFYPLSE
jgi:transposase